MDFESSGIHKWI